MDDPYRQRIVPRQLTSYQANPGTIPGLNLQYIPGANVRLTDHQQRRRMNTMMDQYLTRKTFQHLTTANWKVMADFQAAWHTAMQDTEEYGVTQLSGLDHNEVYDHFVQNERHYNPHDLMGQIEPTGPTAPPEANRAVTKQSPATPLTYRNVAETPVHRPYTNQRQSGPDYERYNPWTTNTTTATTTTATTTSATHTACTTANSTTRPRTATYFVPTRTRPTPTPQSDPDRENSNHTTTTDPDTPETADKTKLSPELQLLMDSLQNMGQNIAQNFRQNINQLTQATADQAGALGRETQEMVNTTLADQHQRYAESAQRVEQNIDAVNSQYRGDTQRQGRRIDQVASLINTTEKNLEDRLERVQRDIQAHAQNVARVQRESQRRADTRPDTPQQRAPLVPNYVPRRQPQPTTQTRPSPKHPTKTNPTPNRSTETATRQAINQPPSGGQTGDAPLERHQEKTGAMLSANPTDNAVAIPPLTGKDLWQATERVRNMTGTFTPKETAHDGTKGKHHEEFASFAKRFEYMANYYQIPQANWAHMFATCLTTNAHDEYLAMSQEQQDDFSQTVEHLSKIYPAPTRNEWTYRTQWDALRQAPNEPLREFIARIESLAHKAHTSRNAQGLEYEKTMKFRYGMASRSLRYDMAAVTAETLQELGNRAIAIQQSRNADPATMRVGTTEISEVARDLGTIPVGIIRTAQPEPQPIQMVEVTRLPYTYPHTMPPTTTCVTYVPASSFTMPATPPPPTPARDSPTQPPRAQPQREEQTAQRSNEGEYPKKRPGDYRHGMDMATIQCYNCGDWGHLSNKCPAPDKRRQTNQRGGNRGRGSRGGNRAGNHSNGTPSRHTATRSQQEAREEALNLVRETVAPQGLPPNSEPGTHSGPTTVYQPTGTVNPTATHQPSDNHTPTRPPPTQAPAPLFATHILEPPQTTQPPTPPQESTGAQRHAQEEPDDRDHDMDINDMAFDALMGAGQRCAMARKETPQDTIPTISELQAPKVVQMIRMIRAAESDATPTPQASYLDDFSRYPSATMTPVHVHGLQLATMYDSGATISVISQRLANVLVERGHARLTPSPMRIQVFGGDHITLHHKMTIEVGSPWLQRPIEVFICPRMPTDMCLGYDYIQANHVIDDPEDKSVTFFGKRGHTIVYQTVGQARSYRQAITEWIHEHTPTNPHEPASQPTARIPIDHRRDFRPGRSPTFAP